MVATTKGPEGAPSGKDVPPQQRAGDGPQISNSVDLDEETYNRVLQLAANQQSTPGEVIRRTVINAFGVGQQTGAWHSGQPSDPALQTHEPGKPDDATGTAADPDESSMEGKKNTGEEKTPQATTTGKASANPSERTEAAVKRSPKK